MVSLSSIDFRYDAGVVLSLSLALSLFLSDNIFIQSPAHFQKRIITNHYFPNAPSGIEPCTNNLKKKPTKKNTIDFRDNGLKVKALKGTEQCTNNEKKTYKKKYNRLS